MNRFITPIVIGLIGLCSACTTTHPYNINPIPTSAIAYAAYVQDIEYCERISEQAPAPKPKLIPSRTSVNFGLGVGGGYGYRSGSFGGIGIQHQMARTTTEQEERHALVVECLQTKGYNSHL